MVKPFLAFLLIITSVNSVAVEKIRLLNWEAYLSPNVIQQWQQSSGYALEEVYFDNDEKRDAILVNSSRHQIDLAVIDEVAANLFGEKGSLIELNEDNVPNSKTLLPFWRTRCGHHALPYFWGTLGIAYRTDKVSTPPTSWRDLLEPSQALQGHIGMVDDFTDLLAPALFMAGRSLNSENEAALREAFEVLKQQVPHVLTYDYAITFLNSNPQAEDLHMALVYGGDQFTLNEIAGEESLWKYVVPKEGTVLWVDCMAVPSTSKHQGVALNFLNYLNTPKVAAQNAEEVYFATPNPESLPYMSMSTQNDEGIYPKQEILGRSQLYKEMSDETVQLRQRIAGAIINIHETQ